MTLKIADSEYVILSHKNVLGKLISGFCVLVRMLVNISERCTCFPVYDIADIAAPCWLLTTSEMQGHAIMHFWCRLVDNVDNLSVHKNSRRGIMVDDSDLQY